MTRRRAHRRAVVPNPLGPVGGWGRADVLLPLIVCIVLIVLKLAFVVPPTVGPTIGDEAYYWRFAGQLAQGEMYTDTKYPPVYPIALAPAHVFSEDPYRAMLVLNAAYSSLLAFPVFALSRLAMGRKASLAVTALQGFLPFHYIMPRTLMSENVYFPLFIAVLFMVLWRPRRLAWAWDAASGIGLATLYLTRYVSLPVIPVLMLVWWMRERQLAGQWRLDLGTWGRFALMSTCAVVTLLPWVMTHLAEGTSLSLALGFGITSRTNPEQHTLDRLWIYVQLYLAYFAILAAPVLGLVFLTPVEVWRERLLTPYTRIVAGVGLVSLSLLVALARHSWRAHYNYPDPVRIMGRYTIYLAALFLIIAFATLVRSWKRHDVTSRSTLLLFGLGFVAPMAVLAVAYWTTFGDGVIPFAPRTITDRGSIDAYRVILMDIWFWVLVPPVLLLTVLLIHRSRRLMRPIPIGLLAGAIVLYSVIGIPAYFTRMEQHQAAARMTLEVMEVFDDQGIQAAHVFITPAVVEATEMVALTINTTLRMKRDGRALTIRVNHDIPPLPPGTEALASEPLDLEVRLAENVPGDTSVLAEWDIDGIRYALVPR